MVCPMYYVYLSSDPTKVVAFGNATAPTGLGAVYSSASYTTASGPMPTTAKQQGTNSDPGNTSSSSVAPAGSTTTTTTPVSGVPVVGPVVSPIISPVTGAAGLNKTTTT